MPDNPRMPGHPSDISSSRSSEGSAGTVFTGPPGGPYNPTPPQASSGNHHTRNLIIGAVATVFTSVIIYYLTIFQNRNKPEANVKEMTIQTWDSYVGYENIYTQNMGQIDSTTADLNLLLKEFKKESEKFSRDVELLSKKKNIDNDLVIALKRRLENEKNYLPQFEGYVANTVALQKSDEPLIKKIELQAGVMNDWLTTYRGMYERAINDIRGITKVLTARYRHNFDINDFDLLKIIPGKIQQVDSLITILENTRLDSSGNIIVGLSFARNIKPAAVAGNWITPGMDVSLEIDGKVTWISDNTETTGTWKIENDKLKIEAVTSPGNKKVSWTFLLAYIRPNSFAAANADPPYEIYKMVRKTP